ncbi:hypothetical protein BKA66DRAFT_588925 [Pyrenochaeta sp. MPI-SDFR-AT-0127]|nr:hypothetical protein BKA66DRAFT_588925 [Pyrenochaeta sp. MPI-SDFR-AT-0127]
MATFLKSPMSPSSLQTFSFHAGTAKNDTTHLSGATMLDFSNGREAYLATADTSPSEAFNLDQQSRRSSYASTTKSQLRHSNHTLIEMLQNIQTELTAHRSIMLDIQSRVSNLEHTTRVDNKEGSVRLPEINEVQLPPIKRTSNLTRESQAWWESCQNFAHNCDTPFNVNEFLKTPRRFSGFDFNFEAMKAKQGTPPMTPEVDDIPGLTPASDRDEHSDADTHEDLAQPFTDARFPTSDPTLGNGDDGSDIVERIVEFDKIKIPMPPLLQSPPRSLRSKSASILSPEEGITALPDLPPPPPPVAETSQRYYKGIKSLFTYKALLRNRTSDKGELCASLINTQD